jgi:uncharacterized membrane protein YgdD (TMEM256/DUF423 family)
MMRLFFALGCLSAFVAVAAGAFAAHGLEQRLEPRWVEIFKTGAQYQMYHALALIAVAWAITVFPGKLVPLAGWFFVAGTVLFSGSLYALALTQTRWLGAITPFGGVGFLVGWALLVWAAFARSA